jgi:hypothetical protein
MTQPDRMTAALLQLAGLAQQLADLDQREAGDVRGLRDQITALAALAASLKDISADHGQAIAAAASLSDQVEALTARLAHVSPPGDAESAGYLPAAAARFWQLEGRERERAIARLRAWVDQIYRPGYGHLSASLGDCWDQHPLCLYLLDWLSELWSVLYLQPTRTASQLAGQAEWQTRLLTAAADQLARETRHCPHAAGRSRMPVRTARP